MDEAVRRAMARWPDVPAVYGWLALDARGRWRLEGTPVTNRKAIDFINRNYAGDEAGRWYFQNGPQRVYADLDYTPWVLELDGEGRLRAHTGLGVDGLERAFLDEEGHLLLLAALGIGVVNDRDLAALAERLGDARGRPLEAETLEARLEALAAGRGGDLGLRFGEACLPLAFIERRRVPERFGFDPRPREDREPAGRHSMGARR